jgi:hypothetical protein
MFYHLKYMEHKINIDDICIMDEEKLLVVCKKQS